MPVNRNALVRYRTIDNCLRNRFRTWTLEDLIDSCSEALYEYEGIDKGVSRRTVQMDIQMMRSDKLGYNAPIVVLEKKYYSYEEAEYSITNIPLTDQDLKKLTEVTEILRQFKGFTHFQDLSGMVNRLEDKIHTAQTHQEPIIDFEKNENLKGLEHIDTLYQSIQKKSCIKMMYQSFKARHAQELTFHPFLLKEFRNRWFVLGQQNKGKHTMLCALDRIQSVEMTQDVTYHKPDFDVHQYFKDVVGVTVNQGSEIEEVLLSIDRGNAPYVLTKPIHPSQKVIKRDKDGIEISLDVQLNFELEREILGFGPSMKVLSPDHFKRRIQKLIHECLEAYQFEINPRQLKHIKKRLDKSGYAIQGMVYTTKEIDRMKQLVSKYFKANQNTDKPADVLSVRQLLIKIPELESIILNQNLSEILKSTLPDARLTKAIYFDKPHLNNWFVSWHQDITINVKERIDVAGYSGWTSKENFHAVCPPESILQQTVAIRIHLDDSNASNGTIRVIPGSHQRRLEDEEIKLITENASPVICEIQRGGVQLMRPLLLHSSSRSRSSRSRRVIHLEFCSEKLPSPLEWSEDILLESAPDSL